MSLGQAHSLWKQFRTVCGSLSFCWFYVPKALVFGVHVMSSEPTTEKITSVDIRRRKGQQKIAALTAYDFTMARLFDEGGVDVLLVGDSLGMVVQGHSNTLSVTLEDMAYHSRAVQRAAQRAHVVTDLPFMSYQASVFSAVKAAGRLVKEGCAEAVKLEGGATVAKQIRAIVDAGIPVMGHVGLVPQSVHVMGGFKVQGRTQGAADRVLEDALAVESAGAYSIVLEGIPALLARRITEALSIPTIGIGAGAACDGQVLVSYDCLGMVKGASPRFVKHFAAAGEVILSATQKYVEEVRSGAFPEPKHAFGAALRDVTQDAVGATGVVTNGSEEKA